MNKLSRLAAALSLSFATGFVAAALLAVAPARAEMIGDYHREAQNIGVVDVDVARLEGLLFALYADRGLQTNDDGVVTAWRSSAGREVVFRPVFGDAAQPARRVANAVGDRAAVRFATAQHRPGYLRSSEHVVIDPDRGLTLFALARVSDATREWATIFGYGSAWRAPGAMTLGLQRRLQALQISGGRRYDHVFALLSYLGVDPDAGAAADGGSITAPVADAAGKGFIVMAVRFDPSTGEQVLFENGVAVARARRRDVLAPAQQMAVGAEVRGVWSFEGDVLAAVAFNQSLEDAQLQAVSQALQLEFGLVGKPVSRMAALLPYAYYPSRNQMEVAIDLGAERIALAGDRPESVTVRVLQAQSGEQVATGTVPLDGQGRGQAIFDVPELPDGVYAVEYVIGVHVERSPKTFRRIHFPFEKTSYGTARKVYPPFDPVRVQGNRVSVAKRGRRKAQCNHQWYAQLGSLFKLSTLNAE